jgi:site-specific DNA recombinase
MNCKVALYARVSSGKQAKEHTIESQLVSLRDKIKNDGYYINKSLEFIDEGYSGSILIRPALERMRDTISNREVNKLYVHSPDRLARKYAYQILLIEEFKLKQVEIVFLNHELSENPESQLLLQMQGMIAEYERAKIMERSRRGKIHAAKCGLISVLGSAPYGYRYIDKHTGCGSASWVIEEEEAITVRQLFEWVSNERISLSDACKRLEKMGRLTKKGHQHWDRAVILEMLKNPAYKGKAAFGRNKIGPPLPRNKPPKHSNGKFRTTYSVYKTDKNTWIEIPVPAIVDENLFETVQAQLDYNRRKARIRKSGAKFLLQGLIECAECKYAFGGKNVNKIGGKQNIEYQYVFYRCSGRDTNYLRNGKCDNKLIYANELEGIVWEEIKILLKEPQKIISAYEDYLSESKQTSLKNENSKLESQIKKLNEGISRLIDSYTEGIINKNEFEPKIKMLRKKLEIVNEQSSNLSNIKNLKEEMNIAMVNLTQFKKHINNGLKRADWETKREIIKLLIKRVEIGKNNIEIVFKINQSNYINNKQKENLPNCWSGTFESHRNVSLW